MKHWINIFIGIFVLVNQTNAALESKKEDIPLFGSMKANQYDLKNGLRLLVVEDHSSPTFAFHTWYRVGSRNEIPKHTGLAHLFEHLLFKRTKMYGDGEFMKKLERVGVEGLNAFTGNDYTAYIQKLPKQYFDLIAKLESERMRNLIVDDKAFYTELEVVKNERRFRNDNSPDGKLYELLMGTAYNTHPYHWPVIGYQEDLDQMKPKNALDFYRSWYSPNQAIIIVVGDIKKRQVLKIIDQYYGKIKPSQIKPHKIPKEPAQKKPRTKKIKLNIGFEKLIMAYHVPSVNHPDAVVFEVLQAVLSDGNSSRLTKKLVDAGIASSISSGSFQTMDPSIFTFFVDLQKEKTAKEAKRIILNELRNLARFKINGKELKKAKNLVRFNFFTSVDSSYSIARFMGSSEVRTGSFQNGVDMYQNKIKKVTASKIRSVVKKYFNPNQCTTVIGVPK